jgi:predicted DNA-binding transcriptional regulator AlpA
MTESTVVLRERKAAEMLGVSTAALRRWRREQRGPAFIRLERAVGYRLSDLENFLNSNTVPCSQRNPSRKSRESSTQGRL